MKGTERTVYVMNNAWFSSTGISGSDRRATQWTRQWMKNGFRTEVSCSRNASENYVKQGARPDRFRITSDLKDTKAAIAWNNLFYMWKNALSAKKPGDGDIIYSSSDFLPDVLPAFVMKSRNPKAKWVAGLHLVAPGLFRGFENEFGKKRAFSPAGIPYIALQAVSIALMGKANLVLVSNSGDRKKLAKKGIRKEKIIVTPGGIDAELIAKAKKQGKKFDACFVGRMHAQKGIHDLASAWKTVCKKIPGAKMAVIGEGPMKRILEEAARKEKMEKNFEFFGFIDGKQKYSIMKGSRIFLFPSTYESFGMSALEAMACGKPVIAYDLPVYSEHFKGAIITVPLHNHSALAENAIFMLRNRTLAENMGKKAKKAAAGFTWKATAEMILKRLGGS